MLNHFLPVRIPNYGAVIDVQAKPGFTARELLDLVAARYPQEKRLDVVFEGTRPLDADEVVGDKVDLAVSTRFLAG